MKTLRETFPGVRAVIFDFDGTLAQTDTLWKSVDHEIYGKRQIQRDLAKYYQMINGKAINEVAQTVVREYGMKEAPETIAAEIRGNYSTFLDKADFTPGAVQFLESLSQTNTSYAIASANPPELNRQLFVARGHENIIPEVFVSCEDVKHGKPAPDVFLFAAARMGVDIRQCVVFEDSGIGLQAARASGAFVVRVGRVSAVDFQEISATLYDEVVDDFEGVRW